MFKNKKVTFKPKGDDSQIVEEVKQTLGLESNEQLAILSMNLASTFAEAQRKGWTIQIKDPKGHIVGELEQAGPWPVGQDSVTNVIINTHNSTEAKKARKASAEAPKPA